MKKILTILVTVLCLLSLVGCGSKTKDQDLLIGEWMDDEAQITSHPESYLTITKDKIVTREGEEVWGYKLLGDGMIELTGDRYYDDIGINKFTCKYEATSATLKFDFGGEVNEDDEKTFKYFCPLDTEIYFYKLR